MTDEFRRDVRAFLHSLAGECRNCFRRNQGYCEDCYSHRAKVLLARLDEVAPANSLDLRCDIVSRMARIAAMLKSARRPLLAIEMDMDDYCSRSGKEFTLRTMMRLGRIGRTPAGGGRYSYFLINTKKTGR